MPYNSSAFEKQLAKYKAAQAGKATADKTPNDPHRVRARASVDLGKLQPNTVSTSQYVGDGPQSTTVLRADQVRDTRGPQTVIIIHGKKKPVWQRGWFIFLVTTILSTAAMPVFFRDEMNQMMEMIASIKSSTGVDPLSVKTYTDMAKGHPVDATAPTPASDAPAPDTDIHEVVNQAQQRAEEVTRHGGAASMQYIEQETRRLNDMARQLDQQYNGKK